MEALLGIVSPLQHIYVFLSLLSFIVFGCWRSVISQWYCALRQCIKQPNDTLYTVYTFIISFIPLNLHNVDFYFSSILQMNKLWPRNMVIWAGWQPVGSQVHYDLNVCQDT